MALSLEQLDTLIDDLRQALTKEDWQTLSELDAKVRPVVAGVMADQEAGDLDQGLVRERLEALLAVCELAQRGAEQARAEAKSALAGMSRNRKATQAYRDISGGRSR